MSNDIPTVLLFDIDGTLVTTGGAGRRAMLRGLEALKIRHEIAFSFGGMTDRMIVRRFLEAAGEEATAERIDAVILSYLAALGEEVAITPSADYRVLPGVMAALDHVTDQPGVAVGLGTGNVRAGAEVKLSRVGLFERFAFGGFGCDAEDRTELIAAGAERGAASLGRARADCRVVVIGDTPRDIEAAKGIGADCVAVTTGWVGRDELAAHGPTLVVDSLAEPAALAALVP